MFVLRTSLTSPFGRKVRMAAEVLGVMGDISIAVADTLDPADTLRVQNPLGKMPCLLLEDGTAIYDSGVIIEFLQEHAGSEALLPGAGVERYQTLTLARLADGIAEAAILIVYEGRFREAEQRSQRWVDHQSGKVARALAAFERAPPPVASLGLVQIGLVCALGYLDWRQPVAWRAEQPRLVAWLEEMTARHPAITATQRPA